MPRPASIAAASTSPADRPSTAPRTAIRISIVTWFFGSIWLFTTTGAMFTQYARELGMRDEMFGLFAALTSMATIMQLPASFILEMFGHRKQLMIYTGVASRLLWCVAGLIPWFVPVEALDLPGVRWITLVGLITIATMLLNFATPSWFSLMADLLPRRIRGRALAQRRMVGQSVGVIMSFTIGIVLDRAAQHEAIEPGAMLRMTSTLIALAGLFGALDSGIYALVNDLHEKHRRKHHRDPWLKMIMQPLKNSAFRWYLGANVGFTFSIVGLTQYLYLFLLDEVKLSNKMTNLLGVTLPLVVTVFAYPIWGRLIDRFGKKPILIITALIMIIGPYGWMMTASPTLFWPGVIIVLISTVGFPGFESACFNVMLDYADARTGGTAYIAMNNIAIAIGGVLSGLTAGYIAHQFADFRTTVPVLHFDVTYHGLIFFGSGIFRWMTLLCALKITEPRARGTRQAMRYITDAMYSNVRLVMSIPTRAVGGVARLSDRVNHRKRP